MSPAIEQLLLPAAVQLNSYSRAITRSSVGERDVLLLGQRLALVVGIGHDEHHGDGHCDQQHSCRVHHHSLASKLRILVTPTHQTVTLVTPTQNVVTSSLANSAYVSPLHIKQSLLSPLHRM